MRNKLKIPLPSVPKINFRRFSIREEASKTIGQAPGTLIYTGRKNTEKVTIEIYAFNQHEIEQKAADNIEELSYILNDDSKFKWVNINGLHNIDLINKVGDFFKLDPLMLEDILHVDQRPKTEDFGDYIFFTIKMFHDVKKEGVEYEHLSFILGSNTVISFQEQPKDIFDLLRERLMKGYGKIRQKKPDYLFYRFIDTIVDNYFLVLDRLAEKIEELEDEVMERPKSNTLQKMQVVRKELIYLRRTIYPLRESINTLLKSESKLLEKETERFLTDLYDHTIQVIESLETYRDLLSGIMDLFMNTASNRMNEIMKVLTIMSTIFIPLTFIAGIYGMNFEHMPELGFEWSYPIVWGLMILVAIGMLLFFRKKKWI